MDEVYKANLVQIIVENCHKYDDEGRVVNLTADEVVMYATTLLDFICGEEEDDDNVEH
jgi:hypothetical protein